MWWRRRSGRKKEGDCHPGAMYLTEHAQMLRESTLYWSGSIGPAEGISSVKRRRSMTSVVQRTVRKPDERGAGPIGLLLLARQFLLNRLTCQSVIDPGSPLLFFFCMGPSGDSSPDRGQLGGSKINHCLFPLSAGFRVHPYSHIYWPLIFLSSTLSISLTSLTSS